MCKKINQDVITIKRLIAKGIKQAKITKLLGLTRQKVSYWSKKDYPTEKKRRKKLSKFYVDKIIRLEK